MIYLDTSILTSYYCPEPNSDLVEEIILQTHNPSISSLVDVEFISAISRKIREGNLTIPNSNRIIGKYQSHVDQQLFNWIPIKTKHFKCAKEWIAQSVTPLRTLDALHLAAASDANLKLLTADVHLAKSAQIFGLEVQLIKNCS